MSFYKLIGVGVAALGAIFVLVNSSSAYALVVAFAMVAASVWYAESNTMDTMLPRGRAVLITGCDTGFGHELCHHLDSVGISVFAGCLDAKSQGAKALRENCSERLHVVQLDVTSQEQVDEALQYMSSNIPKTGFLGVVNNAAMCIKSEIELTTMPQFEQLTQVNILGAVRVTKACLPLLRKYSGRVVNVSSMMGCVYPQYTAAYSLTKHALECFSDILRLEMHKWHVSVSVIEPGNFTAATQCLEDTKLVRSYNEQWDACPETVQAAYGKEHAIDSFLKMSEAERKASARNIYPVIEAMTHALLAIKPKKRYMIGGSNSFIDKYKILSVLAPFLSTYVLDTLTMVLLGKAPTIPEGLLNVPNDTDDDDDDDEDVDVDE